MFIKYKQKNTFFMWISYVLTFVFICNYQVYYTVRIAGTWHECQVNQVPEDVSIPGGVRVAEGVPKPEYIRVPEGLRVPENMFYPHTPPKLKWTLALPWMSTEHILPRQW